MSTAVLNPGSVVIDTTESSSWTAKATAPVVATGGFIKRTVKRAVGFVSAAIDRVFNTMRRVYSWIGLKAYSFSLQHPNITGALVGFGTMVVVFFGVLLAWVIALVAVVFLLSLVGL